MLSRCPDPCFWEENPKLYPRAPVENQCASHSASLLGFPGWDTGSEGRLGAFQLGLYHIRSDTGNTFSMYTPRTFTTHLPIFQPSSHHFLFKAFPNCFFPEEAAMRALSLLFI